LRKLLDRAYVSSFLVGKLTFIPAPPIVQARYFFTSFTFHVSLPRVCNTSTCIHPFVRRPYILTIKFQSNEQC